MSASPSVWLPGPGPLTAPWSVAVKTRPCGGRWPACGRSTPSSRRSSTRYTAGLQGARCPLLGRANAPPPAPTAYPVPHLAGAVQPDPGGEEKDVRRCGCPSQHWVLGATGARRQLTHPSPQPPDAERQWLSTFLAQVQPAVLAGAHPRLRSLLGELWAQRAGVGEGAVLPGHQPHAPPPLVAGSVPGLQQLQPLLAGGRLQLRTHHLRHHRAGSQQPLGLPQQEHRRAVGTGHLPSGPKRAGPGGAC